MKNIQEPGRSSHIGVASPHSVFNPSHGPTIKSEGSATVSNNSEIKVAVKKKKIVFQEDFEEEKRENPFEKLASHSSNTCRSLDRLKSQVKPIKVSPRKQVDYKLEKLNVKESDCLEKISEEKKSNDSEGENSSESKRRSSSEEKPFSEIKRNLLKSYKTNFKTEEIQESDELKNSSSSESHYKPL